MNPTFGVPALDGPVATFVWSSGLSRDMAVKGSL